MSAPLPLTGDHEQDLALAKQALAEALESVAALHHQHAALLAENERLKADLVAERDAWVEAIWPGNRETDMGKEARAEVRPRRRGHSIDGQPGRNGAESLLPGDGEHGPAAPSAVSVVEPEAGSIQGEGIAVQKTIALIKPDAVARGLAGYILGRIEDAGFRVLSLRMLNDDSGAAASVWSPRKFYGPQHEGKPYFEKLVEFMSNGPTIALVIRREDAIARWRALVGEIRLAHRLDDAPGPANLVHGSDSPESFAWERACLGLL